MGEAKMMKRSVFHSTPTKGNGWKVIRDGRTVSEHRTQRASEKAAVKAGHRAEDRGRLGQAVLHRSDGTIREERTYGEDPRRTRG